MSLLKSLYLYQQKRFPIKYLFFTTSASVLCSAAVLSYEVSIFSIVAAFFAVMFFLFHVRVIDEFRDFNDDAKNHPDNPIHSGIISLKQLFAVDIVGVVLIIIISVYYGTGTMIFAAALIVFTTLASKDFFLRKIILKYNTLYHIINSPQMILLQMYIFALLTGSVISSKIVWLLILFVYLNIFVLEVVRKIKISTEEPISTDTYSKSMGFKKSLIFNYILSFLSIASYIWIIVEQQTNNSLIYIVLSIPVLIFLSVATLKHIKIATKKTEKFLLLSVMIMYVSLNLLICLNAI